MKRRAPLKRGKPFARGTTRLKARKTPKAFQKRRDPAYQAWIRQQPCLLRERRLPDAELARVRAFLPSYGWYMHLCWPSAGIQVCHVKSRGAGGDDRGNVVPLCAGAHEEQHRIGIKSFQRRWGIDLAAEAARLFRQYQEEKDIP